MQVLEQKVRETGAAATVKEDLDFFELVCATCFLEHRGIFTYTNGSRMFLSKF